MNDIKPEKSKKKKRVEKAEAKSSEASTKPATPVKENAVVQEPKSKSDQKLERK